MCIGSSGSRYSGLGTAPSSSPSSPYASNYGYGLTSGESVFGEEERQWYIDNGFGDPNTSVEVLPVQPSSSPYSPFGIYGYGGRPSPYMMARTQAMRTQTPSNYYRGVSPEARYMYLQAAQKAKDVASASAAFNTGPIRSSTRSGAGTGVTYTYAGEALGIPKG